MLVVRFPDTNIKVLAPIRGSRSMVFPGDTKRELA